MTIKQQGGIFGRNPTFNDVEIEGDLNTTGEVFATTLQTGTTSASNFTDAKNVLYGNTVAGGALAYGNLSTSPRAAKAAFAGGTTLTFDISIDTVGSWRPYFLTLKCGKVSSNGAGLSGAVFDYVNRIYDNSHSTPTLIDSRGTTGDFTITFTPTTGDPGNLNVSIAQTGNWQICEVTVFNYYSIGGLG